MAITYRAVKGRELTNAEVDANFSQLANGSIAGFKQSGTDVERSWTAKAREIVSVTDFGTTGNGTDSDQTALVAAVAWAFSAGSDLYWPAGTYLSTASIANFHDVVHYGPGIVKRGSTLFYVSPHRDETNTLFVATTGDDTDDGIVSGAALATVQKAMDIISEWAPTLPGRWVISIADGTYTETLVFDSATRSEFPIDIKATTARGHPTVPSVVIQPDASSDNILTFAEGRGWFRLTDLRLTGATTGTALVLNGSVRVGITNVHIDACLNGVSNATQTLCSPSGGIWTGRGKAVSGGVGFKTLFNAVHAFTGTSSADGVQIKSWERALLIHEGGQGHVDGIQISDCGTGLNIKRGAGAVNTSALSVKTCDVGVLAENNAWYNNAISFGTGADANTVNIKTLGDSAELIRRTSTYESKTNRTNRTNKDISHTGATTATNILTLDTIPSWALGQSPGTTAAADSAKVKAYCLTSLTNSFCDFWLRLGTTDLATVQIPQTATEVDIEATVWFTASAAQRCRIVATYNIAGTWTTVRGYGTAAVTSLNTENALQFRVKLDNSGDSFEIEVADYITTIGG